MKQSTSAVARAARLSRNFLKSSRLNLKTVISVLVVNNCPEQAGHDSPANRNAQMTARSWQVTDFCSAFPAEANFHSNKYTKPRQALMDFYCGEASTESKVGRDALAFCSGCQGLTPIACSFQACWAKGASLRSDAQNLCPETATGIVQNCPTLQDHLLTSVYADACTAALSD